MHSHESKMPMWRMAQMKENLEEKNRRDQKAAVEKYMMEQKKVNLKIYDKMKKELPKQMRTVIANAAYQFRKGKVDEAQVMKILNKHFSDNVFQNVLRCVQGDLDFCSKINMQRWQESAERDINAYAKKAQHIQDVEDSKSKAAMLQRVNKVIDQGNLRFISQS